MQLSNFDKTLRVLPDIRSKDVVWLGAGFSTCVTSGYMPVMGNFFDRLEEYRWPNLHNFLKSTTENARKANVEEALAQLDTDDHAACDDVFRSKSVREVTRSELKEYCNIRLAAPCLDTRHWAFEFLASADKYTTVVTTNYDTIAEQILRCRPNVRHDGEDADCHVCGMNSILKFDCNCGNSAVPTDTCERQSLLKLHGSLSWMTCLSDGCQNRFCHQPIKRPGQKCSCCHGAMEPVLILPTMSKRYSQFPHLERMWHRAKVALSQAERLFVFGFSFPDSDRELADVLRTSCEQARALREIFIIDVNADAVTEKVNRLIAPCTRATLIPMTVPRDGSLPSWWQENRFHLIRRDACSPFNWVASGTQSSVSTTRN